MPCQDGGPDYATERLNAATRAACEAMRLIEGTDLYPKITTETLIWWKHHKDQDRQREEREQEEKDLKKARRQALSKLTDEEKRSLGLRGFP